MNTDEEDVKTYYQLNIINITKARQRKVICGKCNKTIMYASRFAHAKSKNCMTKCKLLQLEKNGELEIIN
jgi:uncharacterized CHY-type Zn-finger protein